ncbi:hypothetical protein SAMN04488040_2638 [Sulfitobacter marinus]|uniref:Uncharacterized protein n=1 Tax=Sulfitobacter marinus TaxID=394264 RepID=A0A1I6UC74_9RHOB|nr:hypothetical protein [Sulfitobacter marinus]SFS99079.1 hypothetical protein SAMN04488040_2638 [Sulfitobacter marinus]
MAFKVLPIHTLNARGHVMLEVVRDHFNIPPDRMLFEIQAMRKQVVDVLKTKGINYDELRAALVPDREKLELALIFDTMKIESSWYGYEVFKRLIPLLNPRSKNSILHGDYVGENEHQDILFEAFRDAGYPVEQITFQHSTQFYIVYINNLTDTAFQKLAGGLIGFEGHVGCANVTHHSHFKALLSLRLTNLGVKFGRKIIQGHEDDRDETENVNMSGYPFEENGYECISIRSDLEGVFLSYKIESPVFDGFEVDTEMSINSVNSSVERLDDLDVHVEDAKLEYIKTAKAGSLHHAGLSDVSKEEFREIIRGKLRSNHIYNMSYLA